MKGPRAGYGDVQPLRVLAALRSFASSRVLFFLFDVPFAPIFVIILYFIHPVPFFVTLVGAAVLLMIAVINQIATVRSGAQAAETTVGAMNAAQVFVRNFETIKALGMLSNVTENWGGRCAESLRATDRLARTNSFYSGLSRILRMVLQMSILGIGAYLVIQGEMTAGMIFASSIISGRALQPLDQIIGAWRQIVESYGACRRLKTIAREARHAGHEGIVLPSPDGSLAVEQLVYSLPDSDAGAPPLIKRVSFALEPGQSLALIGPSRAGKSTLARLFVGAIEPRSGVVRIDGSDLRNWNSDALGKHIGYLSQEVELFPGTIAENIARFDPDADDAAIIEAARRAHAHELILGQKKGYATDIGPGGTRLSGGERQRIGLARAFYGDSKLLVLDEPNSNLDAGGEAALEKALAEAKARGATVIMITHKIAIAARCDRMLLLQDGQVELFGTSQDVIQRLSQGIQRIQPANTAQPAPQAKTGDGPTRPTASFAKEARVEASGSPIRRL
ncbi:type I secretion system permease/ATPase [Nitratireductor luteus]|uniref:type I secretion system permease/ATPase n=1 Tax=Nitratireductor luteus TaxID=2976980 RepID=UPI00223F0FCC|nr:type I secretion system permease/ATPase [Nitratireductor luteus]